jgi:hypothetical protein
MSYEVFQQWVVWLREHGYSNIEIGLLDYMFRNQ